MKKFIITMIVKKILLLGMLYTSLFVGHPAKGESLFSANGDGTHFAEHSVASGLIFSGVYLAMHDGLGAPQFTSFAFGAFTSLVIGFTYKYMEGMEDGKMPSNFGKSMIFNGIGIAVPAIVLMHFDL